MQLNQSSKPIKTHEGGTAKRINAKSQLQRSVMACMLWEDSFYESGQNIASRIANLIPMVNSEDVYNIALEAKHQMKIRHVPLLIAVEMLKHPEHKKLVSKLLPKIIVRADELTEILALYWRDGKKPIAHQLRKGLAKSWIKFDEYQLAKYNRKKDITLKDSLFLSHAKPVDKPQEYLWKRLINDELKTPDTWEVLLKSDNKKQVWEGLIKEKKLGALAFLRNLRNMREANVNPDLIKDGLRDLNVNRILPFQIYKASQYAPHLEPQIEDLLLESTKNIELIRGKTALLVDVSGSMFWSNISGKGQTTLIDTACALGAISREIFHNLDIFTFSNAIVDVPLRRGFALADAIKNSQDHGGTYLSEALKVLKKHDRYERLVVISDEQVAPGQLPEVCKKQYMINVASNKNGVGYYNWLHIDGWSENVLKYIVEYEQQ